MSIVSNILAPTDCSEASVDALSYSIKIAKNNSAELTILYVVHNLWWPVSHVFFKDRDSNLTVKTSATNLLVKFWKSLNEHDIKADLVVEYGDPFTKIMDYVKSRKNDVIVMGTNGRTGLVRVAMGSVAEKVIRYSPVPVLTVKHENHELSQRFDYEYDSHKQY